MYCDPSAPQARTGDAAPKRRHMRAVGRPAVRCTAAGPDREQSADSRPDPRLSLGRASVVSRARALIKLQRLARDARPAELLLDPGARFRRHRRAQCRDRRAGR